MSEAEPLQFDRAEFDAAAAQAQCGECQRPLAGFYYDVNGQTVCEACRYAIEARETGGSAGARLARAAGAGFCAAVLGAVLYYAISALTGYEFGLIAIVVGFAVGSAVRWGSNGRGGWVYQALAIMLTYLAIVATYIPPIIDGFNSAEAAPSEVAASATAGTPETATAPPSAEIAEATKVPGWLAVLLILVIACAAPFLAGFENIIGLVIIGIGLYEAWKLNRRSELAISGPHTLARPPVEAAGV